MVPGRGFNTGRGLKVRLILSNATIFNITLKTDRMYGLKLVTGATCHYSAKWIKLKSTVCCYKIGKLIISQTLHQWVVIGHHAVRKY